MCRASAGMGTTEPAGFFLTTEHTEYTESRIKLWFRVFRVFRGYFSGGPSHFVLLCVSVVKLQDSLAPHFPVAPVRHSAYDKSWQRAS
jgi:hypothetical protein